MITKKQWDAIKDNKTKLSEVTNKEIRKYLEDGGIITRREKGGTITFWELDDNGELVEVEQE